MSKLVQYVRTNPVMATVIVVVAALAVTQLVTTVWTIISLAKGF